MSCLCPGSSKIMLAAEGQKNECGNMVCGLCVLVAEGLKTSQNYVAVSEHRKYTKTEHFIDHRCLNYQFIIGGYRHILI